jgi:hypothetical protein
MLGLADFDPICAMSRWNRGPMKNFAANAEKR